MAGKKTTLSKSVGYVSLAHTTKISATSRIALKMGDNYFTVEAVEERVIDKSEGLDLAKEWDLLFDHLNGVIDTQAEDIMETYGHKRR